MGVMGLQVGNGVLGAVGLGIVLVVRLGSGWAVGLDVGLGSGVEMRVGLRAGPTDGPGILLKLGATG